MIALLSLLCLLFHVISGAALNCTPLDNCPHRCPRYGHEDWVEFGDSCYGFLDNYAAFQGLSDHICFIHRAPMLVINDKEEDDFIRSSLNQLFKYPSNMNVSFWTGAYFSSQSNKWHWATNKEMTYTDWYPGQPRGIDGPNATDVPPFEQHCMALVGAHNFTWHDVPCNKHFYTICEMR